MKINYRILGPLCITLMFCLLWPAFAAAANGDGAGDGSGGGQQQPLVVEKVVPADGATGISLDPEIKITFNKNVCYMTVRENNRNCFSMWAGNTRIPIEVIMADDQVERDKRNDAIIKPLQQLKAGTEYRIEIAPNMESKSGVTLGKKATITFTTVANQPAATADDAVPPEKQGVPPEKAAAADPAASQNSELPQGAAEAADAIADNNPPAPTDAVVTDNTSAQQAAADSTADVAAQEDYRYKRIFIDLTIVVLAGLGALWAYRKRRGL